MLRFHPCGKTGALYFKYMRQPYDGANQQVQKVRLGPLSRSIHGTLFLLKNTVCTSFSQFVKHIFRI